MLHIRHRIPAISYSSSFQEFFRKFSCPDSAVKVRSCTPALYRASPGYVHTISQKRRLINKKTPVLTRTRDSCFHLCLHRQLMRYLVMPHTRALYREFPGRPTMFFGPPNSEMHFTSLSISASTLRTRFAVFRTLLFSSSFEVELTLP